MYGKSIQTQGTGCVEYRLKKSSRNIDGSLQCLQKRFPVKEKYDKVPTEEIRGIMVQYQERSHVAPTVSAYYQAIAAPSFCEKAAGAWTRRLAKVFKETLTSLE